VKALVGEDKASAERMAAIPANFMTGVRYVSKNYDSQRPMMQKGNVLIMLLVDECVNT
jgi:hypothetical protein